MNYWIEVTGGDSKWLNKLRPRNKRGLLAPEQKRYITMLNQIKKGDIVFTYLTNALTDNKLWKSSIVGVSKTAGKMFVEKGSIKVKTTKDTPLREPISFSRFYKIDSFSTMFQKNINRNMQKYLIEITSSDFETLLQIHPRNYQMLIEKEFI